MTALLCVYTSCSTKDPTSSHTTEKDWILYTVSTVGFGSSRLIRVLTVDKQFLCYKECVASRISHSFFVSPDN